MSNFIPNMFQSNRINSFFFLFSMLLFHNKLLFENNMTSKWWRNPFRMKVKRKKNVNKNKVFFSWRYRFVFKMFSIPEKFFMKHFDIVKILRMFSYLQNMHGMSKYIWFKLGFVDVIVWYLSWSYWPMTVPRVSQPETMITEDFICVHLNMTFTSSWSR